MKKIKFKKISNLLTYVLYIIVIVFVLFVLSSKIPIPGNYKLLTVMSGSMEPTIKTGSLVVVKPLSFYKIGDIITFKNIDNPKQTTTHRIIEVKQFDNLTDYLTKGDANNGPDSDRVDQSRIVGKLFFHISYLGYPLHFARTLPGIIILIIIPGTIIIYDEILNIAKELKKKKKKVIKINSPVEVR
jgi:signal peptidase